MIKKALLSMMMIFLFTTLACAGSGPDVEEGQWEITVEFDIPGMPMKMPPNTYTQCMKKDNLVPQDEKPNQKCETKDVQTNGNTVSWTVECTNAGGKMTGQGEITYHKDKMDGTMTMKSQGMEMVSQFKGRRIGDCY